MYVRIGYCVPEGRVRSWVRALVLDLRIKGHRFPNLSASVDHVHGNPCRRWEELPPEDRPAFARTEADWEAFRLGQDDLRFFELYFDAPSTSRFWEHDHEFYEALCRVHMRRYDYLRKLLPGVEVVPTGMTIVRDAAGQTFYATESTVNIKRGARATG